jgi:uncharacterized protein
MALILIRGDNNSKLLNAIADMERHAQLHIINEPQKIDAEFADSIVESILKAPLRNKSKVATAFFVKEDITLAIMQIKKIHPPAHVVVVSDEYKEYEILNKKLDEAPVFRGYYSNKSKRRTELKDYKSNLSNSKFS